MSTQIQSNASITQRWMPVFRALWIVCAIVALAILVASVPLGYALRFTGAQIGPPVDAPGEYVAAMSIASALASLAAVLTALALAIVLFWRKRDEPMALLVSFYLLGYGIALAGPLEALFGFGTSPNSNLAAQLQGVILVVPTIALLGLFPNGRFVPGWMRWATLASIGFIPLSIAWSPDDWFKVRAPIAWLLLGMIVLLFGSSVYAQIDRYRRVSSPTEQQKTRWVLFGLVLWAAGMAIVSVPYVIRLDVPAGVAQPWWAPLSEVGWWLSLTILPLSLAISVMRYRLWDVDILLNRALVYSALTVSTMAIYVFIVTFLGGLFRSSGNTLLAFLATGIIALLFQPLRERLERGVNRLLYGERDNPYAVLSRLGQRLETTLTPDSILPTIVETIAQALKLPYVAIGLGQGDEFKTVAAYGLATGDPLELPLTYQSEMIGRLVLSPRGRGEDFSPADRHLLDDIARQAGVAAHAVRLTADLQRSRERLVTAREEERRRLRRDLHDELGPTLASQALKLDAALEMLSDDQTQVRALLGDLKSQTQTIVADIRRLVYELRPPALDELGLVSALCAHVGEYGASASGLHISIQAPPDGLPPLSAAVEVAAYRIALEATTNAVRHAHARECTVHLSVTPGHALQVEIRDDGVGLPHERHTGVGLNSMRERAEELGGTLAVESAPGKGTCIVACLPLSKVE